MKEFTELAFNENDEKLSNLVKDFDNQVKDAKNFDDSADIWEHVSQTAHKIADLNQWFTDFLDIEATIKSYSKEDEDFDKKVKEELDPPVKDGYTINPLTISSSKQELIDAISKINPNKKIMFEGSVVPTSYFWRATADYALSIAQQQRYLELQEQAKHPKKETLTQRG